VTALRADGFRVRIGSAVTDNNAKQGTVVRTVPSEGGRAAKGSAVTLIPSAGPQMIKVPPVAGQQLTAAQAALRGAGLNSQVRRVASSSAAAGIVVSTQPGAGTLWPQPQPVVLMVSEGPPLPYLVGQNVQTIQQWASQNGITLNVQQDPNSTQPQGIITRQSPAAGTPITPNETVTIGVSAGPPQVAVPNVDGQTVDQARQTLKQLGFDVKVSKFGPFNKVFDYTPSGQQPKGTTITLWAGF
jgi:serine/threonine-protein kinase